MQVVELTVLLHDDKELDNDLGRRPDHDLPLPTLLSVVHALESIVQHTDSHHPYLQNNNSLLETKWKEKKRDPKTRHSFVVIIC